MKNHQSKLTILFIIFFLSGISGLIYETVWFRILSRVLGSTVYATSIVIAAFMFGLALGSFFIGRKIDSIKNLVRIYAILEVGVGLAALAVFFLFDELIPVYRFFFHAFSENVFTYRMSQAVLLFFLLVIPTFMMGGTLPVLAAQTKKFGKNFSQRIAALYGLNTLGAVFGVLLSGFFTIGIFGEFNTVLIGVAINLGVSFIAVRFARTPNQENAEAEIRNSENPGTTVTVSRKNIFLFSYALLGFTSFGIEIIWTRIFQLQLCTSVYAFSIVLGIYLLGSATGSLLAGKYLHRIKNPSMWLGILLILISLYTIAGMYFFTLFTPGDALSSLGFSVLRIPLLIIFPVTFMVGFIFPLVSHLYLSRPDKIGSGLGKLYAANTIGCILGSLVTGYILVASFGTRGSVILLSAMNAAAGMLVIFAFQKSTKLFSPRNLAGVLGAGLVLLTCFAPDPFFAVIQKVVFADASLQNKIYFHKEGVAATTTAYGSEKDSLNKHILINGIGMTSLVPETKIMAHLPILLHPDPRNMLIICFGMGTCLRSASMHESLNVDMVELIPEEYETYQFFYNDGPAVLANPRVHHYADDGRNFLLMHENQYDVITLDPAPPLYSAGTVNLYSSEFFQLCKSRLTGHGIMCLWIPPESFTEVKMIMRTFEMTFPITQLYGGISYPGFFMIGYNQPMPVETARFENSPEAEMVLKDLNEWGKLFESPLGMLNLLLLNNEELPKFLSRGEIISDNYPYTEFPLWRKKFNPDYSVWFDAILLKKMKAENKFLP